MKLLTENPDNFNLTSVIGKVVKLYYTSNATTFCCVGKDFSVVIASTVSTHPTLYNGLKACYRYLKGRGSINKFEVSEILKDYNSKVIYGRIEPEDLEDFWLKSQETYGNPRYTTFSGRAWRDVTVPNFPKFSAISFWLTASEAKNHKLVIPTLIEALKLQEPTYIEFLGSKPQLYRDPVSSFKDSEGKRLRSVLRPDLSQSQLIDLLVKSHTAPWSLQPWEREVVIELGGKSPEAKKRIPIELRYKLGESSVESGFLSLISKSEGA